MTDYMFDGAFGEAVIDAVARVPDAVAVSHYLTGPYATSSFLPDAAHARGLACVLNYERAAGAMVGMSRADGQTIARTALAAVEPQCPRDRSVAIYFSVDVDAPATSSDQAFMGCRDVLESHFQVKAYAPQPVLEHLFSAHLVDGPGWLSASTYGHPYNPRSQAVCMVQQHDINGNWIATPVGSTDINTITTSLADVAAWGGDTVTAPSAWSTADQNVVSGLMVAAVRQVLRITNNLNIIQYGQADNDQALSILDSEVDALTAALSGVSARLTSVQTVATAINTAVGAVQSATGATQATEAQILTAVAALPTAGWVPSPDQIAQLAQAIGVADQDALANAVRHNFATALGTDPTPPPAS